RQQSRCELFEAAALKVKAKGPFPVGKRDDRRERRAGLGIGEAVREIDAALSEHLFELLAQRIVSKARDERDGEPADRKVCRYIGGSPSGHPLEGEYPRPGHAAIGRSRKEVDQNLAKDQRRSLDITGHGVPPPSCG